MSRAAIVLRPEPGAEHTAARLAALGVPAWCCPLFAVSPLPWTPPDPRHYDALLLTSANAASHAGPGLRAVAHLPVMAVGEATAQAARNAGLRVVLTGKADAATLVGGAQDHGRLLHLAGRDHVTLPGVDQVQVYASEELPIDPATVCSWAGQVALLHSPRAAKRFAALVDRYGVPRKGIDVAALSAGVAEASGPGWGHRLAVDTPDDTALVALARELIDQPGAGADKRGR